MSRRTEIYIFAGLLVVLAIVLYSSKRSGVDGITGVTAADTRFEPLNVQAPQLRLDLLREVRKGDDSGPHRNIFVAAPLAPPKPARPSVDQKAASAGPPIPAGPPPLEVPAEFFGYASEPGTGRRVAFFTSGDNVLVVPEGGALLSRFRLMSIGTHSADVEEISSGRHATLPLVPSPDQAANP
jgi:hypothetical protein